MKNFTKLLVFAVVITVIASMFVVNSSAAVNIDPNTLEPGSDSVVFIADVPEGGTPIGDGSGKDANNPYQAIDHEAYDPNADVPKGYLNSSFYQATEMLRGKGGTIVICGPVNLTLDLAYGSGSNAKSVYTAQFRENTFKFTSVYNGVDYRETNDAKLIIGANVEIGVFGQSIWENIDIATVGVERKIYIAAYSTLIGEGVDSYPLEEGYIGVAQNYVSISGGHRYEGGVDLSTNMVIKSGTWNTVVAGVWGVNNARKFNPDGTTNWTYNMDGQSSATLVLEGTTKVLGDIVGTTKKNSEFSGRTSIVINDGTYACDINLVGQSGMLNTNGQATLKINGGDFKDCWSVRGIAEGYLNNAPAMSILDLSGFKGDKENLATIYNLSAEFKQVRLPEGVNEAELKKEAETTAPPVNNVTPGGNTAVTPGGNNNGGGVIIGADDETEAPNVNGSAVDVGGKDGGINIGLIIGIAVGVLVLIAVVVVITVVVVTKKLKAATAPAKTEEKEDK